MDEKLNMQLTSATDLTDKGVELLWKYGPDFVTALITLLIGIWIIGMLTRGFRKVMTKRGVDPSLTPFLTTLLNITLKVMLFITVVGMVGIEMTSFVAILGAAGLAIGLSLQGTLQNFASGVMILIFKPFKVSDFIEAAGYAGVVKEIQIFNTIMLTGDNKRIIIPNSAIASSSMTNFSAEELRRVDWTFGIGYGDDYDHAKSVINGYIESDTRILKDPTHFIALHSLGNSSVNLVVRAWVKSSDYWGVYFDMNEKVYKGFAKEGLNIPFPQMDVHVHQAK